MAPGRSSHVASPAPPPLPKVSFRKIEDEDVNEPAGVTDSTARLYGYNDFSSFTRTDHYIRYIEPLESELSVQVEYDMDEQDQEWLEIVNEERKKAQVPPVSSEIFEILMDRLEKEWFELMKRVPKSDIGLPSEDSTCVICDDGEGENTNAIVFCDGCNLAVHQDCYGVPYIPEGQWLCRKCTVSPEVPVSCVFCPNEGGAFKQTNTGNTMFMEPIENVDHVPKSRWKLPCSLCKIRYGACIQCDKNTCFVAFHVTCARRAKLLMGMKGLVGEEASFKGFCEKHLPNEAKLARGDIMDTFEGPLTIQTRTPKSSKTARAYSKKYSLGPPLVPQFIVEKLENYYKKMFRQKQLFVRLVCKYWSLKREARRGAPLLKRLHLEPWTASTINKQMTDEQKALKYHYLKKLRKDLCEVEKLTSLVQQRETIKLSQARLIRDLITDILFPYDKHVRQAFEQIQSLDRNELFYRPVTKSEAADYFDIIKNPMCMMTIEEKLNAGEYIHLDSFKDDINLIFDNAMLYNKRDTLFYKTASRLKIAAANIIEALYELPTIQQDNSVESELSEEQAIGNLEAELDTLNLLVSVDDFKSETSIILSADPITSLLRIEQPSHKPSLPTPQPSKDFKSKKEKLQKAEKAKRDYKLERQKRKEAQAAIAADTAALLDATPGFRAPRATRSSGIPLIDADIDLLMQPARWISSTNVINERNKTQAEIESQMSPKTAAEWSLESGELTTVKPRSWRREHLVLPGQGVPNMVESMDDHDSFKNFDRGWILTSGSRRRSRVGTELHSRDNQPPKKRQRTDQDKVSPDEEFVLGDALHEQAEEEVKPNSMNIPINETSVEELKGKSTSDIPNRSSKKRATTKTKTKVKKQVSARPKVADPLAGVIRLQEGETLPGGTLVWAKMESYPWWAAVVWEEDTSGVPPEVLRSKQNIIRTDGGPLILVQFYDKSRSWQWLETGSLRLLGENQDLDNMLLAGRGKMQIFRTDRLKQNCRKAYRDAIAEMEDPNQANESSVTPSDRQLSTHEEVFAAASSELSELDS